MRSRSQQSAGHEWDPRMPNPALNQRVVARGREEMTHIPTGDGVHLMAGVQWRSAPARAAASRGVMGEYCVRGGCRDATA